MLEAGQRALAADQHAEAAELCAEAAGAGSGTVRIDGLLCEGKARSKGHAGDSAEAPLRRALALALKHDDVYRAMKARRYLGRHLANRRQLEEGRPLITEALGWFRAHDHREDEAWALLDLAAVHAIAGEHREALKSYKAMGKASRAIKNQLLEAKALQGEIYIASRSGAAEMVVEIAARAEALYSAQGAIRPQMEAMLLRVDALQDLGRYQEAREALKLVSSVAQAQGDKTTLNKIRIRTGFQALSQGRWGEAYDASHAALEGEGQGLTPEARAIAWAQLGRAAIEMGMRAEALDALSQVESQSGVLIEALAAEVAAALARGGPDHLLAAERLGQALADLEDHVLIEPRHSVGFQRRWAPAYDLLVQMLVEAGQLAEASGVMGRAKARAFTAHVIANGGTGPASIPKSAEGHMPRDPRTAIVDYWISDRGSLAIVSNHGQRQAHWLPFGHRELAGMAQVLSQNITDRGSWREAAEGLGLALLDPVRPLVGRVDHVVMVPHGPVGGVPWAALMLNGHHLVELVAISTAPTTAMLKGSEESWARLSAVAIADSRGDLPGARREAAMVADIMGGASRVLDRATRAEALLALASVSVVHLAVHGHQGPDGTVYLDLPDKPSPVVLAQASATHRGLIPRDRGLIPRGRLGTLSAADISAAPVRSRLVSLAGCETGLGLALPGGDVMGSLERSLLAAGAEVVLSSYWPIHDKATERLMRHFYAALPEVGPAQALARAQRALIGGVKGTAGPASGVSYTHPRHWAGLRLSGNP